MGFTEYVLSKMNDNNSTVNRRRKRKQQNIFFSHPFQAHVKLHEDHKILNHTIRLNKF